MTTFLFGGFALATLLLFSAWALSRATGIRSSHTTLGSDTTKADALHVASRRHRIHGTPDRVMRTPILRRPYAVERKPRVQSNRLYESHELQAGAYILAMRGTYGRWAAPYADVVYRDSRHRVRLTPKLRMRVLRARDLVRRIEAGEVADRNHDHAARCRGCKFRDVCEVALA